MRKVEQIMIQRTEGSENSTQGIYGHVYETKRKKERTNK